MRTLNTILTPPVSLLLVGPSETVDLLEEKSLSIPTEVWHIMVEVRSQVKILLR